MTRQQKSKTGRKLSKETLSEEEFDLDSFLEQVGEDEPQEDEYELIDVDDESTEDEPEDFG